MTPVMLASLGVGNNVVASDMLVVGEFIDVDGLIDLVPGTRPMLMSPYRMSA